MHEPANILSLRFATPAVAHASRTPAQLTFCYQCHCAVDLGATTTALRSGDLASRRISTSMSMRGWSQRRGSLAEVLRARRGERAGAERVPRRLDLGRRYLLHELSLHRVRQTADQRRHSRHLLRARVPGPERLARSI